MTVSVSSTNEDDFKLTMIYFCSGNHRTVQFPIAMNQSPDADFSFSGLKASVRRFVESNGWFEFF
jgi:tRNA A37 threonylcarbamoyltransferase TsaD